MKYSRIIHSQTSIKSKIGGKIPSQKHQKTGFLLPHFQSVKF